MSEVKEHPILFSGDMVRAILEGRKTMTRRVVKPQPNTIRWCPVQSNRTQGWQDEHGRPYNCPHGVEGDHLWVREMWAAPHGYDHISPRLIPCDVNFHFSADEERGGLLWRPSIHMPRWVSRITLEITGVRVERLQDISVSDAFMEGIKQRPYDDGGDFFHSPTEDFKVLWDNLNAKRGYGWDANPWVWVVAFRRVEA